MKGFASFSEDIKIVNDTDHAIERVKLAAKMCEKLGNTPILYRMFQGGDGRRNVYNMMIKVDNSGRKGVKGDHLPFQRKIFDALKVKNPTQALTATPSNVKGFHGTNYIMIPSGDMKAMWNSEIRDLGGFEGYNKKYGRKDTGGGGSRTIAHPKNYDWSKEVNKAVKGYKKGVPSQSIWQGEIIVDTPYYYMLNLQDFLQKYTGKKSKELVNVPFDNRARSKPGFGDIKKELLQAKFKTYRDIAWYLKNPALNYLKWFKEKEQLKLQKTEGREMKEETMTTADAGIPQDTKNMGPRKRLPTNVLRRKLGVPINVTDRRRKKDKTPRLLAMYRRHLENNA
jgi:hypothetical protein